MLKSYLRAFANSTNKLHFTSLSLDDFSSIRNEKGSANYILFYMFILRLGFGKSY